MAVDQLTPNERLKELRQKMSISAKDFASSLGIKQGSYSDIERGKVLFSSTVMKKLDEIYNINLNWLLSGMGEPIIGDQWSGNYGQVTIENGQVIPQIGQNVIMVPVTAQAGSLGTWTQEWIDQNLVRTSLPGVDGPAMAFEVAGDSMVPTVHPGDYIVGRKVEAAKDIREARVHIVVSRTSGIYIKRVYKDTDYLILESDNDSFPPVALPVDDVHEVYYAIQRITHNFSGPRPYSSRLDRMEDFLAKKFPEFKGQDDQE